MISGQRGEPWAGTHGCAVFRSSGFPARAQSSAFAASTDLGTVAVALRAVCLTRSRAAAKPRRKTQKAVGGVRFACGDSVARAFQPEHSPLRLLRPQTLALWRLRCVRCVSREAAQPRRKTQKSVGGGGRSIRLRRFRSSGFPARAQCCAFLQVRLVAVQGDLTPHPSFT